MRHLIIGAGPAGLAAVDTIREFGGDGPITLISNEQPYSRMVLPYLMDGTISEDNLFTANDDYLSGKNVHTLFGKTVTSIDPAGKATLDDASVIDFDNALIATGSRPTRPPIDGADAKDVFNLWTLDDAKAVIERKGGDVVVIGAGFIAFTCLDALVSLGARLTIVEVEDRILPRMIDETGAELVRKHLESKGVTFRTGTTVTSISNEEGRKKLSVEDGDDLMADVVIMATGIKPNLELVEGTAVKTDFGVLVDGAMRTSGENIFAAGDIAQGPVIGSDAKEVHAIQPTALEHGRIAGANMVGQDLSYWGSLLMNIVDVQKLHVASFGDWSGKDGDVRTVVNDTRPVYRKMVFQDDRMVGAVFLGRPDDVTMLNDMGMVKGLIQSQVALKEWRRYLDEHPLDVRRPYVASRAAEKLLGQKLVGKASDYTGYRHPDPQPKYWDHHATFVADVPSDTEPVEETP
jgi:NADPH-dependent 2,4-dienoyl-CoA reductase/sulfur reductase-like enzyme